MFRNSILIVLFLIGVAWARLPCEENWDGPSPDNDVMKCGTISYLQKEYAVKLGVPVAFWIITLFAYPIVMIGRCCGCCGSTKRRPGTLCCGGTEWDSKSEEEIDAAYSVCSIRTTKLMTLLCFIIAVIAAGVGLQGFNSFEKTYNNMWDDTDNLFIWLSEKRVSIDTGLKREDGTYMKGISPDLFTDFDLQSEKMKKEKDDMRSGLKSYFELFIKIGYGIFSVPIVFFLLAVVAAVFNIRNVLPGAIIWSLYVFTILFCLLGFSFSIFHAILDEFNQEIELHKNREPGVIQWWMVPKCNATANFDAIAKTVADAELENSRKACELITEYCDAGTVVVLGNTKVFHCPYSNNYQTVCSTAAKAQEQILTLTYAKSSSVSVCESVVNNECTVLKCASDCKKPDVKKQMKEATETLNDAVKAIDTYNTLVLPLLDCNVVLDETLGHYKQHDNFTKNINFIRAGFYLYVIVSWILTVVLLMGQKKFFSPNSKPKESSSPYNNNAACDGEMDSL